MRSLLLACCLYFLFCPFCTPRDAAAEAPSSDPPSNPPSDPPFDAPSNPPFDAPSDPPSDPPFDPPFDPPSDPPFDPPFDPPASAPPALVVSPDPASAPPALVVITPEPASIVGGSVVPRGRWPDVVAVLGRQGSCTGTLVAPDVVLTAGHCIAALPYEVVVDTIDYDQPTSVAGGERIRVTWARAYPDWETRYDVGVLLLDHAATHAKPRRVTSACTVRKLVTPNTPVEIVGFGLNTPEALDDNTRLHQATVPITDPSCTLDPACNPAIAPHGEFMAGGHGVDSCFGDSGGPVYIDTKDGHGHALVGLVSRGRALPAAPCGNGGIYVRVDKVISWVQSLTGRKLTRTTCATASGDSDSDSDADPDADPDAQADPAIDPPFLDGGGCSTGGGLGIAAALTLLLCAWLLARKDRMLDARDFDP